MEYTVICNYVAGPFATAVVKEKVTLARPGEKRAGPLRVPLRPVYRPAPTASRRVRSFFPYGSAMVALATEPPRPGLAVPGLEDEHPLYGTVRMAGREMVLVLGRQGPDSPFFDRAWLDLDGDGTFGEKEILAGENHSRGVYLYASFPRFLVKLPRGLPYACRLQAMFRPRAARRGGKGAPDPARLEPAELARMTWTTLQTDTALKGSFDLGGKHYRVYLGDTNCDGIFGNPGERGTHPVTGRPMRARPDQFFLSAGDRLTYRDRLALDGILLLAGTLYRTRIEGEVLRLLPLEGPLARLRLPLALDRLVLADGEGREIIVPDPQESIPLKPGRYRLASYLRSREDDGGNTWILGARKRGEKGLVELSPGGETSLEMGGPYTPTIIPRYDPRRDLLRLTFQVVGAGGEVLYDLRSTEYAESSVPRSPKSKYRPREAEYRVLKGEEVVASGTFDYG